MRSTMILLVMLAQTLFNPPSLVLSQQGQQTAFPSSAQDQEPTHQKDTKETKSAKPPGATTVQPEGESIPVVDGKDSAPQNKKAVKVEKKTKKTKKAKPPTNLTSTAH